MLTFNDLLTIEGVDPERVRLVRHQDGRVRPGKLYEAWRNDRAAFEGYQAVQSRDVFPVGNLLASFVVTASRSTVFVGMYEVEDASLCAPGQTDTLLGTDVSGELQYRLRLIDVMTDYQDKAVIDWGAGTRAWVQRADKQPKTIVEIAPQYEPPFPGFKSFNRSIDEIPTLPHGWQQVLRSVKGVYLMVDRDSGHQYVGSAKGGESFFGRWMDYATDGHGGDVGLKAAAKTGPRSYQVSVLEVVDVNTADETIEQVESYWKNKLLSRTFGLNRN